MKWLKAAWTPVAALGLAALAIFAAISAARHKATADAWRDKAVSIEEGNVVKGIETAEAANMEAALHDLKANERSAAAANRITQIGAKHAETADILDNWRKS